jgi:deoxyribose-phosphate aldolase
MKPNQIASMIDHTLLKPEATMQQIDQLCKEAINHCFATVCVNPSWVTHAAQTLKESNVKVCTVIGFPLGATTTAVKRFETIDAVLSGAHEIDMVMNIGALKSGNYDLVKEDIEAVVEAAEPRLVKVILEISLLNNEEISTACIIAKEAGAAFVKTSTGFGASGATVDAVKLMRKMVGDSFGVKAAGGIKDHQSATKMIEAGANRLGVSAGVAIVSVQEMQEAAY